MPNVDSRLPIADGSIDARESPPLSRTRVCGAGRTDFPGGFTLPPGPRTLLPMSTQPSSAATRYAPGQRVVVTQQIPQRDEVWTIKVEGVVQRYEQKKTGSWFAHSKDDKLWLDRLTLEKDDGEIVVCNLDRYTRVEVVG